MSKIKRLQGDEWHSIKNTLKLIRYYKSDRGNFKGIYKDENNKKYSHWLNDEEKEKLLNEIKNNKLMEVS